MVILREGEIRGILCHGIKKRRHQNLIYSTELRLNTMKISFLCGNFD
jgi:hypothetical protein